MRKIAVQGIGLFAMVLFTWYLLSGIDWMNLLRIEHLTKKSEEKLGSLYWEFFNKTEDVITNKEVFAIIDSVLIKICESNDIERREIKLHIVRNNEINAFALPDQHLVVFTGLIQNSSNPGELAGVICHELAHMELDHISKKLIKEVGLSVLISMSAGNGGSDLIRETGKLLSSTAYDRKMEKEADIKAADYLINTGISPQHFANFLSRLSIENSPLDEHLSWISTHPDSGDRAKYILDYRADEPKEIKEVLSPEKWTKLIGLTPKS